MSSEVPLLTFSELDEIARNIQIDYCLGKVMSFDSAFARAVEQAVRAQWAAEVAAKDAEIAGLRELANQHQTRFSMVVAAHTERDSAQAEAKAAKADAERYRWLRDSAEREKRFDHTHDQYDNGHKFIVYVPFIGNPTLDAAIDAQLATPTNPRAGETA